MTGAGGGSPTRTLATVADPAAWRGTPAATELAGWIVLDTLTVAAAALTLEAGTQAALRRALLDEAAEGPCVAAGARGVPATAAAAVTGCAAHGIDYDDTYLVDGVKAHLSVAVVAAAFAVAQRTRASGARFLDAVVRGVEAAARLGHAATPALVDRWHPTAVLGGVGAAVAAGHLLDLTVEQVEQAVGLAADRSAGTRSCLDGADATKPLHGGLPAREGVVAARMVAAGVPGPVGFLDKPAGFADTYLGGRWDPALLAGGPRPLILGTSTKFFPVMHALHAAVQASLSLAAELGPLRPADVAEVVVEQPTGHARLGALWQVPTPLSARLSLPYAVGVSLLDGACGLDQLTADRVAAADVRAVLPKVRVVASDDLHRAYGTRVASTVRLHLADGRVVEHTEADPLGTPQRPATADRRLAKAAELAGYAPHPAAAGAFVAAVRALPDAPDLDAVAGAYAALCVMDGGDRRCR